MILYVLARNPFCQTRFCSTQVLKSTGKKVVLVSSQSCSGKLGTIKHRDDDDWHKRAR